MSADSVLRAAVYRAVAARDNPSITPAGYTAALQVVVDVHVTAPLREAEEAIERAKAELEEEPRESKRRIAAALEVLRETNDLVPDEARGLADLEAMCTIDEEEPPSAPKAAPEVCNTCLRERCSGGPDCWFPARIRLGIPEGVARGMRAREWREIIEQRERRRSA